MEKMRKAGGMEQTKRIEKLGALYVWEGEGGVRDEPKELAQSLAKEEKRVDRWKKKRGNWDKAIATMKPSKRFQRQRKTGGYEYFSVVCTFCFFCMFSVARTQQSG